MLRTRLYLGLLPFLLIVIAMGVYAIRVNQQLSGSLTRELVDEYQDIRACDAMRSSANAMTRSLTLAKEGRPWVARGALDRDRSAFQRELMAQSARSAGKPRAPLVATIDAAFQAYAALCTGLVGGGGMNSLGDESGVDASLYRVLHAIDQLTQYDDAASRSTAARTAALAATTMRVLLGAMLAAFLLSLLVAWRTARSLLQPIQALTASAEALGEGDLDRTVPESSRDELGRLGHAFNAMAGKLRAYREATVAKVLRTQRTMEATLTSAPDPLFVVARSGEVQVRNPAADRLAALPEFAHGFPPEIAGPLGEVLERGEHYLPTDYRHVVTLRLGPEDRHYLPRILAVGDTLTEFKGAAVILQDVTKFRLLDHAKSNLVGTVSHELKTPLTSLRMAVYLLLEENLGPVTAPQREMLESARDDANRLLGILDALLDLSRLEAGASALARVPVPVGALLRTLAGEAGGFIAAAGQTLEVEAAPGLGEVSVDPDRIRHVFINLLANASKYSPAGRSITLSAAPAAEGFVRFAVRDQGMGIPAEALPHLFERFYRVPGHSQPGAGIGLALVREIVVAHGGSIACTSEVGRGSEFHFLLPAP